MAGNSLRRVVEFVKPLCEANHLNIVLRSSSGSDYLKISNPIPDQYLKFFPNLQLIIHDVGDSLSLQLFSQHHKLFKETVVKNFRESFSNPDQYLGLITVFSSLLAELSTNRYDFCQGAFEEANFVGDFSVVDIKTVFIENVKEDVVYRSRNCSSLIERISDSSGSGVGMCEACSEMRTNLSNLNCIALSDVEMDDIEGTDGEGEGIDPSDMLSQYLEVSIDDDVHRSGEEDDSKDEVKQECEYSIFDDHKYYGTSPSKDRSINTNESILKQIKPKMSYKKLIMLAIEDSPFKMLKLNDIYEWILGRFPGFKSNRTGFQNSIRHNLSLNKVFVKVDMPGLSNGGKGNYWTINPKFDELSHGSPLNRASPVHRVPDHKKSSNAYRMKIPPKILPKTLLSPTDPSGKPNIVCKSVFFDLKNDKENGSTSENDGFAKEAEQSESEENSLSAKLSNLSGITINIKNELPKQNFEFGENIFLQKNDTLNDTSSLLQPVKKSQPTFLNNLLYDKLRSLAPHPVTLNKRPDNFLEKYEEVYAEKPNFSYKELIMISIFCDFNRQMCLNDIYLTIKRWFPYYQQKAVGLTWQNSIRHNLSLNRCFKRLSPNDLGSHRHSATKGGNWTFEEVDETWKKLMTTPMKWKVLKIEDGSDLFELFEILAARSGDFAKFVFPKLCSVKNSYEETGTENASLAAELADHTNGELHVKKEEILC
eukprot:GFUD01018768.1.p1 GENE.GFUD01018768.1~~GFUD01018768.1.p1  ORF type:complete len:754 (+),score=168.65 GFUD01018768.1:140-2263(+)